MIAKTELFSPEVAKHFAKHVKMLRLHWIDRGHFFTLGAAAYADDPDVYPNMAATYNILLRDSFAGLYGYLASAALALDLGETPALAFCSEDSGQAVGLPGFHIFESRSNGIVGDIHTDAPHERIKWDMDVKPLATFTLPLELPDCGGGMDFWPKYTEGEIDIIDPETPHDRIDYEIGNLYTHTGEIPHRIANCGDMIDGEFRITLQCHAVQTPYGVVLYF